ncbi:MAG: acyl dehydratase [Phenylobacterium sp.]|nr:acyl dehydratase [Phenylobacterium sp.]
MSEAQTITRGEEWQEARITDEALAPARATLGQMKPIKQWNHVATRDNIWHWAHGIGDDNPLWWDEAYAARSPLGGLSAPPTYLYSHANGPLLEADEVEEMVLPGVLGLWAGERWVWHRPVRLDETILGEGGLTELTLHENGRFGGRSATQVMGVEYRTAGGELVAERFSTIKRFERGEVRSRGKYLDRPLANYSEADRQRIEQHYRQEAAQRRGDRPRYYEDTRVGEKAPTLMKGPLTINNLIGFLIGQGSSYNAPNRMLYSILDKTPGIRMINPETGVVDNWESPHWEPAFAKMSGYPDGYDFGNQRFSWMAHAVTDWMGDHGQLREMEIRLLRPNILNDLSLVNAEVVQADDEAGTVALDVSTTNQLGEVTARGRAVVALPRKG